MSAADITALLAADMEVIFDPTFGPGIESVVYTKVGNTTRTINAVIDRDPPLAEGDTNRALMRVIVANNATTGILSSEINSGGDTITVAYRKGETAVARRIRRTVESNSEDDEMLKLELE